MLSEYLQGHINFLSEVPSWEESIRVAAQPLVDKGMIMPRYIDDMIENVNANGPYIVVVPGIAMPHAQNKGGVLKTAISFLKLETPVRYPQEKEVSILFVLAALDSTEHLTLISDLSSLLIDEDVMEEFKKAVTEEEIIRLIRLVE
ncbi:MAG TPA: PTS sugar transporter subunit IIA [Clostridiaceae bacterium]|nr:PTS sugar transporter subunit IIA [Clostridiaceae bacterium]